MATNSKPKQVRADKRRSVSGILLFVLLFAAGVAAGYLISRQVPAHAASGRQHASVQGTPGQDQNGFPFVNPLYQNQRYQKLSIIEVEKMDESVRTYIREHVNLPGEDVAVYFRDLTSNRWFGYHETTKFSPSSLLKVPIMIAVLKKAQADRSILEQTMNYTGSRENQEKGMDASTNKLESKLVEGKTYTVEELLKRMIDDSDNEATILLLDFIGEDYVHQVEQQLGYLMPTKPKFYEDIITVRQYSSFFRVLYNASYLNAEFSNMALELMTASTYKGGIRRSVPPAVTVSHKYGRNAVPVSNNRVITTQLHQFGIVYSGDTPYLVGIMTRGDDEIRMERIIHDISAIIYQNMSTLEPTAEKQLHRDTD